MKIRASFLLLTAALLSLPAWSVEPWLLGDCNPAGQENWQAFEAKVRSAKPDSVFYVPKPYPQTEREVIADYLYQYKGLHREALDPRTLPANEKPLLDGILGNTVSYAVKRVENWTPMRCAADKKRDFYYLVQVSDATSGQELTRVVLDNSGLIFLISNTNGDKAEGKAPAIHRRAPLPDVREAMVDANSRFGMEGESPEYVTTFGSIDCYFAEPCLAFHHDGRSYVVFHGDLFEMQESKRRLVQDKDVGNPQKNTALQSSLQPDEQFLSLGGPIWTIARKVRSRHK